MNRYESEQLAIAEAERDRAMDPERAWRDCVQRRGTAGGEQFVTLLRAYFMEGFAYGQARSNAVPNGEIDG